MASYANGVIPNNNVGITDIRQTLGHSNTQQYNCLGHLCVSDKVNMWSKFKPLRIEADNTSDLPDWWKGQDDCGIEYIVKTDIISTINAIISGIGWTYKKPRGGQSEPYRLGDFRGYKHKAHKPFSPLYVPDEVYIEGSGSTMQFGMNIEGSMPNNVSLSDIGGEVDLDKTYLGLAVRNSRGNKMYWKTSVTFDGAIDFPIGLFADEQVDLFFFLSTTKKTSISSPDVQTKFVPFEGINVQRISIIEGLVSFDIIAYWSARFHEVSYDIRVTNRATYAYVMPNCLVNCRYGDNDVDAPFEYGEHTDTKGSLTVPPLGEITTSGVFVNGLPNFNTRYGYVQFVCSDKNISERRNIRQES